MSYISSCVWRDRPLMPAWALLKKYLNIGNSATSQGKANRHSALINLVIRQLLLCWMFTQSQWQIWKHAASWCSSCPKASSLRGQFGTAHTELSYRNNRTAAHQDNPNKYFKPNPDNSMLQAVTSDIQISRRWLMTQPLHQALQISANFRTCL